MHGTYLLGLQHLILKDVCDAVPDHLQPARAVCHHVAVPVHNVSCGDMGGVIRHSFITAAQNSTSLNTHCETDYREKSSRRKFEVQVEMLNLVFRFFFLQLSNPTPDTLQQTFVKCLPLYNSTLF